MMENIQILTPESFVIVEISKAEQMLEKASDIYEMIDLRDKAAAFQVLANARGFKDAAQRAKIFQLNAERKAGLWLMENVNHKGAAAGNGLQDATRLPDGVDKYESHRWQLEASVPSEKYEEWKDECLSTGKEITAAGLQRVARQLNIEKNPPELPDNKYRIIYADPPWKYGNTMPDYMGVQDDHYPLMSIDEICNLPVRKIAADNSVLFLWVTSPILEESFQVIEAWGFKYKASFVWDKVKHVMGHYNSVRHELLLVCTRGSCQPDTKLLFDSVVSIERTDHSVKPDYFREMIDTLYPNGKRIELFSRRRVDGWDSYGNEVIS